MKRKMVVMCLVVLASCFLVDRHLTAQVNDCADCDGRFVNARGDKVRKLTVKRDLKVKEDLFVDGKVGIGTTNPVTPLHLVTSVTAPTFPITIDNIINHATGPAIEQRKARGTIGSELIVNNGDFIGAIRRFGYDGSAYVLGTIVRTAVDGIPSLGSMPARLEFYTNDGSSIAERMRLTSDGKVGIGTTNPGSFKLAVNGSAAKIGGGSWSNFSDERLKTIHGTFDAGLEEVLKLQPIIYRYNKHNPLNLPDEGEHVGFSAQEVQKVIPEAVSENCEGYLMVNNDPIMWTMLNAIKELKVENDSTKKDNAALKEENKHLREGLLALKGRQSAIEDMLLALSTELPKEKLAKLGSYTNAVK